MADASEPQARTEAQELLREDLTSDPPTSVWLELTKGPKRPALQRRRDHPDEQYYLTLHPQTPVSITHPFTVVDRIKKQSHDTDVEQRPELEQLREVDGKRWASAMQPGRRYRFGAAEGERIATWWWGTKDEVLAPEDGAADDGMAPVEGSAMVSIDDVAPVEIEVFS